jgi:transcriptional regulator with XRE-family HTH domain
MTNLTTATAAAVREHVRRHSLRQVDVALALGLSQQAVSDRLTGRTPFTLSDLERLAELLGVPVAELLQPRSCQPLGETA